MSMNVSLHPCYSKNPIDVFYSDIRFELNSWSFVLKDIIPHSLPITMPVQIKWIDKTELRQQIEIDTDCTWLVEAKILKKIKFYENDWHPDRIEYYKAMEAYFHFLPDDWKVIVYYI